jgi:deoxyribodipyrimidine photo-lyase
MSSIMLRAEQSGNASAIRFVNEQAFGQPDEAALVNAATCQLQETGWMHNRARLVVASFLCKNLLINWQWGEAWFNEKLIDGELAVNNGGWQWCAGSGADAAPYFRVFNPVIQSKKFDPSGAYIRAWIPELENVPDRYIHAPWEMPFDLQNHQKCVIGKNYPSRIVEHSSARLRALEAYKISKI